MNRRPIAGSRILITGASQGIGRALAVLAVKRGAWVLAAARSIHLLDQLSAEIRHLGGVLEVVKADITCPEDRQLIFDKLRRSFGGLDVLINNAGIGATGHFAEGNPDHLRAIMEVNFFGTTEMTRICLPLLEKGRHPAIVNVSSIAGKRGIPARSEYSASKFAVQGWSEALRAEMVRFGIDVIVVCPGLTQTNFSRNMLQQTARMKVDHMRGMTPEAAADAILKALAHGRREVVLTAQGKLLSLVSRFLPGLADRIAAKKVRALFHDEIAARRAGAPANVETHA
ncbi:MAG TPA: SDR family oxidoreductase [Gemmataceae bacterium]|jgi:short-subunit dehydrogenase